MRTPYFEDIAPSRTFNSDSEALTALDDANLAGLDVEIAEFSLDVEIALLSDDEKVAVGVYEGALIHALCGGEDVCCETFAEGRVAWGMLEGKGEEG